MEPERVSARSHSGRTAVILGLKSESAAAEPPPETTRIRIHDAPITCFAPIYISPKGC
jgi:hypothetical protein